MLAVISPRHRQLTCGSWPKPTTSWPRPWSRSIPIGQLHRDSWPANTRRPRRSSRSECPPSHPNSVSWPSRSAGICAACICWPATFCCRTASVGLRTGFHVAESTRRTEWSRTPSRLSQAFSMPARSAGRPDDRPGQRPGTDEHDRLGSQLPRQDGPRGRQVFAQDPAGSAFGGTSRERPGRSTRRPVNDSGSPGQRPNFEGP